MGNLARVRQQHRRLLKTFNQTFEAIKKDALQASRYVSSYKLGEKYSKFVVQTKISKIHQVCLKIRKQMIVLPQLF